MAVRQGETGPIQRQFVQAPVVPAILDGDSADVACAADANFIGATAVSAVFNGAPAANLGIIGAWVSNAVTGVVTIRFSALTGNVAGGAQSVRVSEVL